MNLLHLIWILPLTFTLGYFTAALMFIAGHGESDEQ